MFEKRLSVCEGTENFDGYSYFTYEAISLDDQSEDSRQNYLLLNIE